MDRAGVNAIYPPTELPFTLQASLHFLEAGHYLFVEHENSAQRSKFVSAADVAAAFSGQEQDTGWLPAGVVRSGYCARGPFYVYSAPAQKMEILLTNPDRVLKKAPIPRTVLLAAGADHWLWALKSSHFSPEGQACRAPFPNVYTDGRICWGATNRPPEVDPAKARQTWQFFFRLPFNADLANGKSSAYPTDVREQLAALAERKARAYPAGDLVEDHHRSGRIGDIIDTLLKG